MFYLSAGYTDQTGVIVGPNNAYKRTTRSPQGIAPALRSLTVGGNFSYVDARGNFVQKGSNVSGLMLGALRTPPDFNNSPYLDQHDQDCSARIASRSRRVDNTDGRGYDNPFFVIFQDPEHGRDRSRVSATSNAELRCDGLAEDRTTRSARDYYNNQLLDALAQSSSSFSDGPGVRVRLATTCRSITT